MQKAMQVGLPHSLQFFLGESLKISKPFSAIVCSSFRSDQRFDHLADGLDGRGMTHDDGIGAAGKAGGSVVISISMPRSSALPHSAYRLVTMDSLTDRSRGRRA